MKNDNKIALRLASIILPLFLLFMTSCNTEEGKEFASFFVGFIIFLVGTVLVGIPGIVFSAISISSKHKSVPILAIVFTSLYAVFFIMMMSIFSQGDAMNLDGSIAIFPIINIVIIIMNIAFIVMGYKKRANQPVSGADEKIDLLDDIINDEGDEDLI
jgi:hypothetical protein